MRIGIPREIKDGERRVGMVPAGVRTLRDAGHAVIVEREAGVASGFADEEYRPGRRPIVDDADEIWHCALIVKVKEVQRVGVRTAAARADGLRLCATESRSCAASRAAARVWRANHRGMKPSRDARGALPLLAPMSRIAGRLAPIVGAAGAADQRAAATGR